MLIHNSNCKLKIRQIPLIHFDWKGNTEVLALLRNETEQEYYLFKRKQKTRTDGLAHFFLQRGSSFQFCMATLLFTCVRFDCTLVNKISYDEILVTLQKKEEKNLYHYENPAQNKIVRSEFKQQYPCQEMKYLTLKPVKIFVTLRLFILLAQKNDCCSFARVFLESLSNSLDMVSYLPEQCNKKDTLRLQLATHLLCGKA